LRLLQRSLVSEHPSVWHNRQAMQSLATATAQAEQKSKAAARSTSPDNLEQMRSVMNAVYGDCTSEEAAVSWKPQRYPRVRFLSYACDQPQCCVVTVHWHRSLELSRQVSVDGRVRSVQLHHLVEGHRPAQVFDSSRCPHPGRA